MSKKKVEKRTKCIKPFVKYINVRHIFPTRYVVDMDLKKAVDEADLVDEENTCAVEDVVTYNEPLELLLKFSRDLARATTCHFINLFLKFC